MATESIASSAEQEKVADPLETSESTQPPTDGLAPIKSNASETQYPSMKTVFVVMVAMYLAMFLTALDQNIIATAIPHITDEFHSIDDIGWYGSSYLLTSAAFQLVMGRFYKLYSPKWVFLAGILVFEIGSAVCGAAPDSVAFIIGRAIAGLGTAGILSGLITIIFLTLPLEKRPMYQGFMGAVFGLASVAGPLLGGVFTDDLTWRWCFYINLPIGGIAAVIIILILHLPDTGSTWSQMSWREQVGQLDPIGNLCLLPGVVCLLLALQWGGSTYSWQNVRIIVLLILFGVFTVAFIVVQLWKQDKATTPPRIVKMRSIASGMWFGFFSFGSVMVTIFFLPLWFQAIKGVDAVHSGIMTIPMIISLVLGNLISGVLISKLGYFTPFMIISAILMPIGAGLLTTFTTTTDHPEWISYQVLYGFGAGLGMQQPVNAAQAVLGKQDISIGASIMLFMRLLGGAIFLSVAQNLFTQKLITNLSQIPGLDSDSIAKAGALNIRTLVPAQHLTQALEGYNNALRSAFLVGLAMSCVTIFGALTTEWISVKRTTDKKKASSSSA